MDTAPFLPAIRQLHRSKQRQFREIKTGLSSIGLLLFKHGVHLYGHSKFHINKLCYSLNKPPTKKLPDFSKRHSENYVGGVIVGSHTFGIDVEKLRTLSAKLVSKYHFITL